MIILITFHYPVFYIILRFYKYTSILLSNLKMKREGYMHLNYLKIPLAKHLN